MRLIIGETYTNYSRSVRVILSIDDDTVTWKEPWSGKTDTCTKRGFLQWANQRMRDRATDVTDDEKQIERNQRVLEIVKWREYLQNTPKVPLSMQKRIHRTIYSLQRAIWDDE